MPVPAPSDKRFRRVRARPARRRRVWLRQSWRLAQAAAAAIAFGYAAYRGAALVLHADSLRVTTISIVGNSHVSTGELVAKLEDFKGQNIIMVDLDLIRASLLKSSWVSDAHLRRVLPGTIDVRLTEREPIGIARLEGVLYLVDEQGVLIDEYGPNYAQFDLPIIDGLKSSPDRSGLAIDSKRVGLAARAVKAISIKPDLFRRISQIDVHDEHDAVVILADDTAWLHLGHDQFLERLHAYLELRSALRARVPQMDYVDMRFEERVYVRPAGAERHETSSPKEKSKRKKERL